MRSVVRGVLGALVGAMTALVAAGPAMAAPPTRLAADAPTGQATISLLHGVPGLAADVWVGGQVLIAGFQPGQVQDLSAFAGQTLHRVEVHPAGSPSVLIGPVPDLTVPSTGNITLVVHLRADATPTITAFDNDTSTIPAGQGRLTFRNVAATPPLDVVVGPATPFAGLANGAQVSSLLPAGPITQLSLVPPGGGRSVPVADVNLRAGEHLIVFVTGDAAKGTLTTYAQSLTGLGGAPTRVNTGNSERAAGSGDALGTLPRPTMPVTAAGLGGLAALFAAAVLWLGGRSVAQRVRRR